MSEPSTSARYASSGSASRPPNSSNKTARKPTSRTPAATACRSSANSVITLEINARFSRVHSRTSSTKVILRQPHDQSEAARTHYWIALLDCLRMDLLYESSGANTRASKERPRSNEPDATARSGFHPRMLTLILPIPNRKERPSGVRSQVNAGPSRRRRNVFCCRSLQTQRRTPLSEAFRTRARVTDRSAIMGVNG
jgi:hypothetical protein